MDVFLTYIIFIVNYVSKLIWFSMDRGSVIFDDIDANNQRPINVIPIV